MCDLVIINCGQCKCLGIQVLVIKSKMSGFNLVANTGGVLSGR